MFESSTDKFDFSDIEGRKKMGRNDGDGGCRMSSASGFLMVLLAIGIAVGVGLIVHFAGNQKELNCNCSCGPVEGAVTMAPGFLTETCKASAVLGNQELCGLCPAATTAQPQQSMTTTMRMETTSSTTNTTTPPTPPPGPVRDVRLPTSVKPLHYVLQLRPEMYNNRPETFTFNGTVAITVECNSATNNITLHIAQQNLTATPTVEAVTVGEISPVVLNATKDTSRQFLILALDKPLVVGSQYIIRLAFEDKLSNKVLLGLHVSTYKDEAANMTKYIAVTQFAPTFARHAFPCFDEPTMKATFDITLERQPHIISLSNMPLTNSVNLGDGYIADHFDVSVIMPTYLVAFILGELESFGVYTTPANINQTGFALQMGSSLLDSFEEYFNISFALPKLDNVGVPDFIYGAMENWGIMAYQERYLLYTEGVSTTRSMEITAEALSHEIVHSWFGNLVSPAWWDDIWLNEGFAVFLSYFGVDLVDPEWDMMDLINLNVIQPVMDVDSVESVSPLYREAYAPEEILALFDMITYFKGCAVIRMMWFFLGPETFRKGLQGYLREKAYGNVAHDDLWRALQTQAIEDGKTDFNIKTVMDSWILQTNYPVVTVRRANGGLYLNQRRFLLQSDNTTDFAWYSWNIPFTYTTDQELHFNKTANDVVWMAPNTQVYATDASISKTGGWVIGNIQHYGYFRVNYEPENWNALITQLKTDFTKIHVVNRGTLITDVWALFKAGQADLVTAWDMLTYLRHETEYIPWAYAANELEYPTNMLVSRPAYGNFERFMLNLLEGRSLNVSLYDNRPTQERSLSGLMFQLSCKFGVKECTNRAIQLFNDWKNSGTLIPPDIKEEVFCKAIQEGGEEEWDYMFNVYVSGPGSEQAAALQSLACTNRLWIISRYLEYTLDPSKIRQQDAPRAFNTLLGNTIAFYPTFDYLLKKWEFLVVDYGVDVILLNGIIAASAKGMYTEYDMNRIKSWRDAIHPADAPDLAGFSTAINRISVNMEWHNKYYEKVANWLEDFIGQPPK
ncbi:aminopeptidase Ey-like [Pecten maximus]|uniref:aminopeptidase Ey-like n=1 Tax=Pecten maximus TaxID=6579 RepID=UPI0014581035|nr:aminopeptidase Ey-like [Pecten maximus]